MGHLDRDADHSTEPTSIVRIWWTERSTVPETLHGCTDVEENGEHSISFNDSTGLGHTCFCEAYEIVT